MLNTSFDTLLEQADGQARRGDWKATYASLQQALKLQPQHAGTLNGLGACLLQLGQPQAAVVQFRQAAALAADSPDAHNNLGLALTLAGQPESAEAAYQKALAVDAEHAPAWKNLAQLYLQTEREEKAVPILASLVKSNPQDAEALFLLGACYEMADEKDSARDMYTAALKAQPENASIQSALARVTPQEATRLARPEHAKKLAALKSLKKPAAPEAPAVPPPAPIPAPVVAPAAASVAFFGVGDPAENVRLFLPGLALEQAGRRVKLTRAPSAEDLRTHDVLVFSRPHLAPSLMDALRRARQAGRRIIVDVDEDFHHLPAGHPRQAQVTPAALADLEEAIRAADVLTTASPALAEAYGPWAKQTVCLPGGWSQANPLWAKPTPRRHTLNLGWLGDGAHQRAELLLIRDELLRLAKEIPTIQLVIAGDPEAMALFDALPETRRLYLPPAVYEDLPFVLAHFDILLWPLRSTPYNLALPDQRLVEAGARGVPWLASPLPAAQAWAEGGRLVDKPAEWGQALRTLALDPEAQLALGQAGRRKADRREALALRAAWQALL